MAKDPAIIEEEPIWNEAIGYGDAPDSSYYGFDPTNAPMPDDHEHAPGTPCWMSCVHDYEEKEI